MLRSASKCSSNISLIFASETQNSTNNEKPTIQNDLGTNIVKVGGMGKCCVRIACLRICFLDVTRKQETRGQEKEVRPLVGVVAEVM